MARLRAETGDVGAQLGEAYLGVGVESMTMVPQGGFHYSPHPALLESSAAYISMGDTAENVARRYEVARADQEQLAFDSHRKAATAREQGRLRDEIVAITTTNGEVITEDGCIRPGTTIEALAALKPVFDAEHGVVTAGTSSPLTDGASAVLVTSEAFAHKHGLQASAHRRHGDDAVRSCPDGNWSDSGYTQGAGTRRPDGGGSGCGGD